MKIKSVLILCLCLFTIGYTNVLTYTQLTRIHDKDISFYQKKIESLDETIYRANSLLNKKSLEVQYYVNTISMIEAEREREILEGIKNYIVTFYKRPEDMADKIAKRILYNNKMLDLPVSALVAVMETESEFKPTAVSKRGARGLMQVNPAIWAKPFNVTKSDLHDIDTGIDIGSKILRIYLDESDQDMKKALYKYVGGDSDYYKKVYINLAKFQIHRSMNVF